MTRTRYPWFQAKTSGVLLALLLWIAPTASAAPVLVANPGALGLVVVQTNDPSTDADDVVSYHVEGFVDGAVFDSDSLAFLGGAFVVALDPLPSNHLTLVNAAFNQAVEVYLDFPGFFGVPVWQVPALAFAAGPITDPALIGLQGILGVQFRLPCATLQECVSQTPGGYVVPYVLESITGPAVPEPGSLMLVVSGLVGLAARSRYRRRA